MTRKRLLASMDSDELTEWMAYDRIDPFGLDRADLRAAIVAVTTANAFRGKKSRPAKVAEFMPRFDKRRATPEELGHKLRIFTESR